jgi:hypothetical protein
MREGEAYAEEDDCVEREGEEDVVGERIRLLVEPPQETDPDCSQDGGQEEELQETSHPHPQAPKSESRWR